MYEQETTLIEWKGPSRPHRQTGMQAFTVPTIIAVLIGLILLVAGEWMLIAVVAAVVFAYYTWTMVPSEEVNYAITSRGVRVAGKIYEWPELTRWWVEDKWGQKILVFEAPGGGTLGRVIMPLGGVTEEKIDEVMGKVLLNEKPADTALDKAGKWLGEKFPLESKI